MVTLCAYEAEGPSSSPAGATHPTRCKIGTRACSWELKSMDSSNDRSPGYMLAIACCLCCVQDHI